MEIRLHDFQGGRELQGQRIRELRAELRRIDCEARTERAAAIDEGGGETERGKHDGANEQRIQASPDERWEEHQQRSPDIGQRVADRRQRVSTS